MSTPTETRPPIIVHMPRNMRRTFKAFQKHGPLTKITAVCGHQGTIPENVEMRHGEDYGYYMVCGPHSRYYVGCRGCGYIPDGE